jgi:UDP-N-acetylmuramate--alanine ligase
MEKKLEDIQTIYFIGIGGIGMSAIARYFHAQGKKIYGYDKTATNLTEQLQQEGIQIQYEDNIDELPKEIQLVVYTPAIPSENKIFRYFLTSGIVMQKRAEVLGWITRESFTVAVAGTHGKTTTSTIVAHILKQSSLDCNAFLGGISQNYQTNLLLSSKESPTVVEADEYDRSFLKLFPNIAIITSVDADHLDIYGNQDAMLESYQLFANQVNNNGYLILNHRITDKIKPKGKFITYGIDHPADYSAHFVKVVDGKFVFDVHTPKTKLLSITFSLPGRHNIENALAAIAVADILGVSGEEIKKSLETFKGIHRRFQYIINSHDVIFIDDYAHHPTELQSVISSVKELYPDKKITGIFQPHLFSRTKDFADDFAHSLELLNEVIVLDIYPAREKPIEGIDAHFLLKKINMLNKSYVSKNDLIENLKNRRIEVLMTLGAGDIDKLVEPIKKIFLN